MPPFRMKQRFQIGADFFLGMKLQEKEMKLSTSTYIGIPGGLLTTMVAIFPRGKKLQITIISFSIQTNQIPLKKIDI